MRIGYYFAVTYSLFLSSVVVGRPIQPSSSSYPRELSARNALNSTPSSLLEGDPAVVVVTGPGSGSTPNSPFTVCVNLVDTGNGVTPSATFCPETGAPQAAITPDPSSSVQVGKDGHASIYATSMLKPNGPYLPAPSLPIQTSVVSQSSSTAGADTPVTRPGETVLPTPPAGNPTSVKPCSSTSSPPSNPTPETLSPPRLQNPDPQRFPQTTSTSTPAEQTTVSPPPPATTSSINSGPTPTVRTFRTSETVTPTVPTAPSRTPVQQTAPSPPLTSSTAPPNPSLINSLESQLSSPSLSSPPPSSDSPTPTLTNLAPDITGGINIVPMHTKVAVQGINLSPDEMLG